MNPYELQIDANRQRQSMLQRALLQSTGPQPGYNNLATALGQIGSAAFLTNALGRDAQAEQQLAQQNQQAQSNALANILAQRGTPDAANNLLDASIAQSPYLPQGMDPIQLARVLSPPPPEGPKPYQWQTVGTESYQLDPMGNPTGTKLGAPKADTPKKTDIMVEAESLFPGDPVKQSQYVQQYRSKPNANVNVDVGTGAKEQDKTLGKFYGDQLGALIEKGMSAPKRAAQWKQLGSLLDKVSVRGAGAEAVQSLKRGAKAVGLDLEALGLTDDTGFAEASTAIRNQLILEAQQPGGPIDVAGALSDRDLEIMLRTSTGITDTPLASKLIIEMQTRLAQRESDVAKLARDYAEKNGGRLDSRFFDQLAKWSSENELFGDMDNMPQRMAAAEKVRADMAAGKLTKDEAVGLLRELGFK